MGRALVVDAHVHFWDPAALRYAWLEQVPQLERAFLPPDYFLRGDEAADAVICVEADCDANERQAEVQLLRRLAEIEPRIAGIVAFVDLTNEHTWNNDLDRFAAMRAMVGVRHNIQGNAPGFCLGNAFVRGVQSVGDHALVFDVCATADQLLEVEQLVERCGATQFVLDHCGKPPIRNDAFAQWSDDLLRIAAHANVSCKLSGLFSEARAEQRTLEAMRPYAEHVLQCFGVTRLLYGSDWPVVTASGATAQWRSVIDGLTAAWTLEDRQLFYGGNAIRLYGLELHDQA
ncbi:MAG: amidohydrolase family protein [bacterium]